MKQEQNKMGTKPVKVLLLTMGLPMILSMVVQAFYNIVDSYFVSAIGEGADEAVHALTLAFPIQMLMVAVGVGTGIGVSAWISQYLGMNNRERASRLAGNAIFLGVCTYGLFLLFGLFLAQAYLRTQTGEPLVLELAGQYLSIVCIWSLGCNLFMTYEKLLQATGKGHFSTIAQLAGAVANIILDPILIFGYWGLPAMGVAGAAWATVIGQLEIWAGRTGADIVRQHEGADPAAVVYDGIQAAKARHADVILCDTAGRLHNKANLMNELSKISRIIDRELPEADKEVLLVLDATTGQNGLLQAKQFKEIAGVTAMALTKLDGTAKGGIVIAVADALQIPVKYIGVGEKAEDLMPFDARDFVDALL